MESGELKFIELESERLTIRRFTPDDYHDLFEYLSNEDVIKYEPYDIFSEEQAKQEAINRSENPHFWAVCLKATGKLIGNVYLAKQDFDTWELGYVFNKRYWGNGYATEAVWFLIECVFSSCNARRIVALCNPQNEASWKLLERIGMRKEGYLRKNIYFMVDENKEPIWQDTYEYGMLRDEWQVEQKQYSTAFWSTLDTLVADSKIIIDRPKGSRHPKYPDCIYPVDYGYLENTTSMDGGGIDVWHGTSGTMVDAIIVTVDLLKKDSEIKILIGCSEGEKQLVLATHNESEYMKGIMIRRECL